MAKCANSYQQPDGKPGPCKSGKPASQVVTVTIHSGGEMYGSEAGAHAHVCADCAMVWYNAVVSAMNAQARAGG